LKCSWIEAESDILLCDKHYHENRCSPQERVRELEKKCLSWEVCKARNPKDIGWSKISAETFAEILNSFVEPISYKTMFFIFGCIFVMNLGFRLLRSSHKDDAARVQHVPPPTPSPMQQLPPGYIPVPLSLFQQPMQAIPSTTQRRSRSPTRRRTRSRSRSRSRGRE